MAKAKDNPFSGFRLSEQVGLGQLDQRLFTSRPPDKPKTQPNSAPPAQSSPPATEQAPPAAVAPPQDQVTEVKKKRVVRFDLSEEPLYKATFVFTQEELERLEDLKLELRRDLDTKVTKYDLVRSALHMLLEDHAENGVRSYARRKMKKS